MKSSDISRKTLDYLESKNTSATDKFQIEDIDTVAEHFILEEMKAELTAEWWRFFLGNRQQQPNRTFFVKGQMLKPNDKRLYETESVVEREKLIVIPIDNWISVSRKKVLSNPGKVENVLRDLAIERMNRVTRLQLWIDNEPVQSEPRIISPLFEIEVTDANIGTLSTLEVGNVTNGKYFALSDGYWLFMPPDSLARGHHSVKTFGSCATGVLELQMQHLLHIV